MKVLHMISGGDKGGAKTSVFSLLTALNEEIDITIACFTEGVFYQEVQELPVKSVLFKQKFRYDLSIVRKLKKYVKQEGFNIIHAHGARANFISMILKPFVKVPIITTVHSDYKLDFTDKFYKRIFYTVLNSISLRTLDYYIGVSEEFRKMLISRGFNENKVFSVYNAVDFKRKLSFCGKKEFLSRFNYYIAENVPEPLVEVAKNKHLIGIIGRFDHVKGHDIFIKAAAEVLKDRNDVLFLMAGEGFEEENLRKLAKSLGILSKIIFTGFVTDIFSFINAIDINVCASRSESFPYMLLEGALMKKPTVSTAVGGIPELIKDNKTGFLVPDGDYKKLAEKINIYINDKSLSKKHGENLYHFAKNNFSKKNLQDKSIEIYKHVLKNTKKANFDIMLSGYYGYKNSGDDALLDAVIKSLRREKEDLSIIVLSKNPQETMNDVGAFSIHRLNFFKLMRYMKRTRLIVYGGGSHMQDITSTRSLVYYTFLIHLAKYMGLRIMLYGNGIGPITKQRNALKAKKALEACDYISLRDPESLNFVRSIGVKNKNVTVSIDPVFSLSTDDIKPEKPLDFYFVVSLRPWHLSEVGFVDKIAEAINYTSTKYGLKALLIPMHTMDLGILKEVAKKLNSFELIEEVFDYKIIMAKIKRAEFAMCMRLHGLIYAAAVHVPIIGLVYDPKVANFISYINANTKVDTSNLDLEKLKKMIDGIMKNPYKAKEHITEEHERLKKLSNNDAKVAIGLLKIKK